MAQALTKGQNAALPVAELAVAVRTDTAVDIAALLLTGDRRVRSDDDFVFFNQPHGPGVRLSEAGGELSFALGAVPADVDAVRVVLTLGDADDTFGRHGAPVASIRDTTGNPLYEYAIEGLTTESVVIAVELYRRGPAWKVRAVGQGYAGGFAALVTDHGVTVDDAPPAEQPVVRSVPGEARLSAEHRQRLDLSKREVAKVLLVKQAAAERARVVLVIDKTGSMLRLYRDKVVHRVVRRMIPVAIQLDDDGVLEPYLYAKSFLRLPDVTVDQAESWSDTYLHVYGTHGGIDYKPIGASNNEIPIISEVMSTLRPGDAPTLVLFFTDGGFSEKSRIARLMREAAALPAFWQFVGLGQANYGLLRTLDELDGRLVDNAGFFAVDDIDRIDDAELYARLLGEFPAWLTAARAAGVVR
ncbi:General stress protein 16U [Nocardia otitidiscaviarum]|uniref:General stress protein 16U n=1 Tax=Nocardia otitidiscaviarum TaxID=1823 RepID=A0A378YQE5_9NOCA|nr:VWA domain-containing protein [Nocardia otitidiscaviarum]SUA78790.1 General stress protein 16U [Nocardia otitidiscaviarum]